METGVFLDKKHWGRAKIIHGDAYEFLDSIEELPINKQEKQALTLLYEEEHNYLPHLEGAEALKAFLTTISYAHYLQEIAQVKGKALQFLRNLSVDEWAYPIDYYSAYDAYLDGFPGFAGLDWQEEDGDDEEEPYIFIYPDGNATIARQLVRRLIPEVATSNSVEELITAKFDYQQLDRKEHPVQLRLNSTVAHVKNTDLGAEVAYWQNNNPHLVHGKKVILACNHGIIPKICLELES